MLPRPTVPLAIPQTSSPPTPLFALYLRARFHRRVPCWPKCAASAGSRPWGCASGPSCCAWAWGGGIVVSRMVCLPQLLLAKESSQAASAFRSVLPHSLQTLEATSVAHARGKGARGRTEKQASEEARMMASLMMSERGAGRDALPKARLCPPFWTHHTTAHLCATPNITTT